ncbi:hypothetical protein JOC55_003086 [Paenibacillus sacheonensis]|nr:hypothetical protein [Paenibacillus sacheonensis]
MKRYPFMFFLAIVLLLVNVIVYIFEPFEPKVGAIGEPHKDWGSFISTTILLVAVCVTTFFAWQRNKNK